MRYHIPPRPPSAFNDQTLVLLNDDPGMVPDAVECMSTVDVMVGSEGKFSKAAAALSANVKVLTDQWELDSDEEMVALDPAKTVAGMPADDRAELTRVVGEWHECALTYTSCEHCKTIATP